MVKEKLKKDKQPEVDITRLENYYQNMIQHLEENIQQLKQHIVDLSSSMEQEKEQRYRILSEKNIEIEQINTMIKEKEKQYSILEHNQRIAHEKQLTEMSTLHIKEKSLLHLDMEKLKENHQQEILSIKRGIMDQFSRERDAITHKYTVMINTLEDTHVDQIKRLESTIQTLRKEKQDQYDELTGINTSLKRDLTYANNCLQDAHNQFSEYKQTRQQDIERINIKHDETVESLKKQLEGTRDYIKGLKSENNAYLDTIKELTTERNIIHRTAESQTISSENRLAKITREYKILSERYTIKEEEMKEKYQQEIDMLKRQIELLEKEKREEESLKLQNDKLSNMMQEIKTEYNQLQQDIKGKNERLSKLQEQLTIVGEHEKNARTQLTGAKTKLTQMLKQHVGFKNTIDEHEKNIQFLNKHIEEIKEEKDVLFQQYQRLLKSTQDTLQSEHHNTEHLRKELQQMNEVQRKYTEHMKEKEVLVSEFTSLTNKYKTLSDLFEKQKKECEDTMKEKEQTTTTNETLVQQTKELQSTLKISLQKLTQHREEIDTLKKQVAQYEKDVFQLNHKLKTAVNERDELIKIHTSNRERMIKYELDHEKMVKIRDETLVKLENLNEMNHNVASSNVELKRTLEQTSQQVQNLLKDNQHQQHIANQAKKQWEELQATSKKEIKLLTDKVQRISQELVEKQSYIAETDKLVESLSLERRTTSSLSMEKSILEKDIQTYKMKRDSEIKQYRDQERTLTQTIQELQEKQAMYKKESDKNKEYEQRIKTLVQHIEEINIQHEQLKDYKHKWQQLKKEKDDLQQEYEQQITKMSKLSTDTQHIQQSHLKDAKQMNELKLQFQTLETNYKESNQQCKLLLQTCSQLEKELLDSKQFIEALQITLKKHEAQQRCVDTLQADKDHIQQKYSELQRTYDIVFQKYNDLSNVFKEHSKSSEQNIAKIFQLENGIQERIQEINQLQRVSMEKSKKYEQEIKTHREKIVSQENELKHFHSMKMDTKKLEKTNSELEQQLNKIQVKYDMLGSVLKDTQKSLHELEQKYQETERDYTEQRKILTRTIRDREMACDQFKSQIDKLTIESKACFEEREDMTQKYSTALKTISQLQQKWEDLNHAHSDTVTKINDLREDNKQLREQNQQHKSLHIQNQNMEKMMEKYQKTIADLKDQLQKKMLEPAPSIDTTPYQQHINNLKTDMQKEKHLHEREREHLQKNMEEQKTQIKLLEMKIRELELALKHAPVREMYTKLEEEHQELSLFKIDMKRKYQVALQRMEELKKTIQDYEKNETDIKELYVKIAMLEQQKNNLQKECTSYQQTVPTLHEQIEKHQQTVQQLKEQLAKQNENIEKLQTIPKQMDMKVKQLREESIRTIHKYIQLQKDADIAKDKAEKKMKETIEKNNLLELSLEQAKMDVEHFTHIKNELKQNYNLSIEQVFIQVEDLKRIVDKKEMRVKELEGMLSSFTAKTLELNN